MGIGYLDNLAAAAVKKSMPKAERKAAKTASKHAGRRPLRPGRTRTFFGDGVDVRPLRKTKANWHPMTGAPRVPKGTSPMQGPLPGPMPGPHYYNPPPPDKPKTGWNKHAAAASKWAKGHKGIVAGAGGLAIAGTVFSNNTGPGSPKSNPGAARGIYGF